MRKDLLFARLSRPRIGIRLLVDNRPAMRAAQAEPLRCVGEQIEKLLRTCVRYGDGAPAECVTGDRLVGCAADAALVSQQFSRENVGAVISVARAWAYPAEVMEYSAQLPQAIWGMAGAGNPGTVFMAAATATAEQRGIPVFKIYGRDIPAQDDLDIPADVAEKLTRFAQCALTAATLRGRVYLSIGGMCMGIGASALDHGFFRSYLDMRTQTVDQSELIRRMECGIYDPQEYTAARQWIQAHCAQQAGDANPAALRQTRAEANAAWDDSVRLALVLRDLMEGNSRLAEYGHPEESDGGLVLAAGFQGQRNWTDGQVSSDVAETFLNSSFDWGGPHRPLVVATENDALQAVTMAWGALLTGTAQIFCDVRAFWSSAALQARFDSVPPKAQDGFLYLTNSGPAALDGTLSAQRPGSGIKPFWEMQKDDISACLSHVQWNADKRSVFPGGGFSPAFQAKGGVPLTMLRLNLVKGLGPVLQIIEGETLELPKSMSQALADATDPTWMRIFFVPRLTQSGPASSVYGVIDSWGSNHCTLCSGHCGGLFATLASMLRIPVCMHNLPEEALFRPAAWHMFGQGASVEADFRACAAYGPLYGKY